MCWGYDLECTLSHCVFVGAMIRSVLSHCVCVGFVGAMISSVLSLTVCVLGL